MQDDTKIEKNSGTSDKRKRRRKDKMLGYYILVFFLVVVIGSALSVTVFFNIKEIVVIGSSQYENVDIIRASGILKGDNLIRLDTQEAREKVLSEMLYLDDIRFRKKFADKLEVELFPSREMAYVKCQGGYLIVSEGWRILGVAEKPEVKGLVRIEGFNPDSNELKKTMTSSDKDKDELLKNIISGLEKTELSGITMINIEDKYDIELVYEGRINIIIGNSKDMEYKLEYAKHILTESLRNKVGYLIYHDSLGYSYVAKEEYDMINNHKVTEPSSKETVVPEQTEQEPAVSSVTSETQAEVTEEPKPEEE